MKLDYLTTAQIRLQREQPFNDKAVDSALTGAAFLRRRDRGDQSGSRALHSINQWRRKE